ncbi:hypothetical protein M899_1219 [Bacteriovorax sp. BSW11_IV]|uniref:hypothetical protein n=1 Tax=Bacteriovorax sp. BSW11_IV TaxID=1353529 RepID=UPI000389E7A9|nr:hypothetical protein [Bacteriovorax sp. BSW11_IV]EQC48574.1 hypothetical protein M899_1219 [Bacteriovorax sp. BSW11_IV]
MKNKDDKVKEYCTKYFSKKTALIICPETLHRTSLKKLLIELGMGNAKIHIEEDFKGAAKFIENNRPNIVISHYNLIKYTALDLLEVHVRTFPNRIDACFFVLTDDNSPSAGRLALDTEVDAVIATPFSVKSLEESIVKSIKYKLKPSPYHLSIEKAKAMILSENYNGAKDLLNEALTLHKMPIMANFYLAKIRRNTGDNLIAEKELLEILQDNGTHYPTLRELYLLYGDINEARKQYNISCQILENYPLSPSEIPDLTRLSIKNAMFEDIIKFDQVFSKVKYASDNIKVYLSAGLAICGRFFVTKNRFDEASKSLQKSAQLSSGKPEILKNLITSFIYMNKAEEALNVLNTYKSSDTDEETITALEFMVNSSTLPLSKVIEEGMRLIQRNVKDYDVFKLTLDAMEKANFPDNKKEELVDKAKKIFPAFSY